MAKYLIIHFGDFESLCYQSAVFISILKENPENVIDIVIAKQLDDIALIKSLSKAYIIPEGFFAKRKLQKNLSNQYDYIINMHRDDYQPSLNFVKGIKCKQKIGYNKRRKYYHLAISKEKKDHLIDHYLKVCDLLEIEKTRNIELNIHREDKAVENKLLIFCEQWPLSQIALLIKMPMFRMFDITLVGVKPENLKSWKKLSYLENYDRNNLNHFSVIITDDVNLKVFSDALEVACIFLVENDKTKRERFPIYKKSYAITARLGNYDVSEIEIDAVVQAFNLLIDELE